MSFRLVLKLVTLNDLEQRNGHYMCYFTEFGEPVFQHRHRLLRCTTVSLYCGQKWLREPTDYSPMCTIQVIDLQQ